MKQPEKVKILRFYPEKCNGCLECERACSYFHFKIKEGGDKSAVRILKENSGFKMNVCDQRGLCLDVCQVGALTRKKNGVVWLDKDRCVGCLVCVAFCPINAMRELDAMPFKCVSCGSCIRACPEGALDFVEVKISDIKEVVYHKLGV